MPTPEHRASDAEREAAADRLRAAAAEGRLDPDELEERLAAAYGARTIGQLVPLTADLPATPAPEPSRPGVLESPHVRRRLASFLTVNLACIAIWLATGADSSFWPGWVLLGTGIALVAALVRVVLGVDEDDADEPGR
jgi:Domain of unknown function (DUF1707)